MKILYIGYLRIPTEKAHGFQIMKMCAAFAANGHTTELIVPKQYNRITEDPFAYYGISPAQSFSITKLDVGNYNNYTGTQFSRFFYHVIHLMRFLLEVRKRISSESVLVYTRNATIAFFCGLFCPHVEVVYEAHGVPNNFFFHKFLLSRAVLIIAITKGISDSYRKRGLLNIPIHIEADAVDIEVFDFPKNREILRRELHIPEAERIALYAGSFSLYSWKGVDVLIDAVNFLPADVRVYLVGGSEEEIAKLSAQAKNKQIVFVPRLSRAMVARYLTAADVLVLPNRKGDITSEYFTSPLKLFEYMASETPIVASALPSIQEVLNDKTASFVTPNDPKALAEGIIEVLSNKELSHLRAKEARKKVEYHTWDLRAQRIISALPTHLS